MRTMKEKEGQQVKKSSSSFRTMEIKNNQISKGKAKLRHYLESRVRKHKTSAR